MSNPISGAKGSLGPTGATELLRANHTTINNFMKSHNSDDKSARIASDLISIKNILDNSDLSKSEKLDSIKLLIDRYKNNDRKSIINKIISEKSNDGKKLIESIIDNIYGKDLIIFIKNLTDNEYNNITNTLIKKLIENYSKNEYMNKDYIIDIRLILEGKKIKNKLLAVKPILTSIANSCKDLSESVNNIKDIINLIKDKKISHILSEPFKILVEKNLLKDFSNIEDIRSKLDPIIENKYVDKNVLNPSKK